MDKRIKEPPLIPASKSLPELTFKVIILSIILAAVLAASNAFLALKIGTTISASIPASVLALGILRLFKNSNVLESNIIQTAASGGEGVAAAASFVLPALIILHYWEHFAYWPTFFIISLGGVMGVMFSIPLRRVLLNLPSLKFPEGTAIGNVLKVSSTGGSYFKLLAQGGIFGGLISFCQTGFKVIGHSMQLWFTAGRTIYGFALGFTPATIAAGFIVGFEVGISLFVGVFIGWIVLIPVISSMYGYPHYHDLYDSVLAIWKTHLRYVGVGTMLVGGIWTLFRLVGPVVRGLKDSFSSLSHSGLRKRLPRTERDIPIIYMLAAVVVLALLVYIYVLNMMMSSNLLYGDHYLFFLAFISVIYILVVGFILATICGYFTGLIGSSNNPLSGILIIAIMLLGGIFWLMIHSKGAAHDARVSGAMIMITAIVACIASISNENIQDLKAGQMVGATPWKQQLILCVGVVVSALILGPVLDLLFKAYGIAGVFPRSGMDPTQMLPAPQSSLFAAIAEAMRGERAMPWPMVLLGCGVAVVVIVVDEYLRTRRPQRRLPALAVGLGIYLPPTVMVPVFIGGLINYFVRRRKERSDQQAGVLLACGLVAGNALMGVFLAIPFVLLGSSNALAIVPPNFKPIADILGLIMMLGLCYWMYRVCKKD